MAVSFNVKDMTRGSEYNIYPEEITVDPELNGRHTLPDIMWLVNSILRDGQDTPVSIRKDGDQPVLTFGYSRYRAIMHINKHKLAPTPNGRMKMRCVYKEQKAQEGFLSNVAENRFRNNTTPLDDAYNIKRMIHQFRMSEEEVAAFYFPIAKTADEKKEALKWVKTTSILADLSPEAEKALSEGRLKLPSAQKLAKLSQAQQREAVKGNAKVKTKDIREAAGKPKPVSWREVVKKVIDTGKFQGIGGDEVEASDHMLEFLGRLVG